MKIRTNFNKEKGTFILPVFIIAYSHKDKELAFGFMFACWIFSMGISF